MAKRGYEDTAMSYQSNLNSGGGRVSEFTRLTQTITTNTQKVAQNLQKMQNLVTMVGSKQDTPQMRDELHKMQHFTNQICKDTSQMMKELNIIPLSGNQSEQKQQRMMKERLTSNFTEVLNSFQSAQRQLAEREKAALNTRSLSNRSDPFAFDDKQSEGHLVSPIGSTNQELVRIPGPPRQQQISLQADQDIDLQLMHEREKELRQLEHDIRDVNTIFKDLAMLVHEQGETIDSIEANVENASVRVEEGVTHLQKAKEYQSKARKKKCILLLILLIIVAIIVVILAVTLSR